MSEKLSPCLGIARLVERDGKLWFSFPPKVIRQWDLRPGDVVRWRKMPRRQSWKLTFFRNGQKLLPKGQFVTENSTTL